MANLKPELSKKNKYWIDRNRYYELKYFCLQYPLWKRAHMDLDASKVSSWSLVPSHDGTLRDPVALVVSERELYSSRMAMVEKAARDSDPFLSSYILKAVTEGHSFTYLESSLEIPCSRDTYYDRYRKFFWLLDQYKDGGLYV